MLDACCRAKIAVWNDEYAILLVGCYVGFFIITLRLHHWAYIFEPWPKMAAKSNSHSSVIELRYAALYPGANSRAELLLSPRADARTSRVRSGTTNSA
jgi:hypothetical protein